MRRELVRPRAEISVGPPPHCGSRCSSPQSGKESGGLALKRQGGSPASGPAQPTLAWPPVFHHVKAIKQAVPVAILAKHLHCLSHRRPARRKSPPAHQLPYLAGPESRQRAISCRQQTAEENVRTRTQTSRRLRADVENRHRRSPPRPLRKRHSHRRPPFRLPGKMLGPWTQSARSGE